MFFRRCIVSVLFLIGEGKEEPDVIDQLLDVEANPCRYIFVFILAMSNICLFDKSRLSLLGRCALDAVILNKVAECESTFLFTFEHLSSKR
jgi:hypothetical protein